MSSIHDRLMTIQEIATHFEDVQWSGPNHFQARCPCHDDRKASLSVTLKEDGHILVYDHAHCETGAILQKVGLTFANITPDKSPTVTTSPKKDKKKFDWNRIVATYDYPNGTRKLRDANKNFCWQHIENGNYKPGRGSAPHVLYRAGLPGDRAYICEGEKDCNSLAQKYNAFAASVENGAGKTEGKWLPEYTEELKGLDCVILQDNDEPGINFANEAAKKLTGTARSVKLLDLKAVWPEIPEHGDISDMIEQLGAEEAWNRLQELEGKTGIYQGEDVFASFGFYSVPDLTEAERKPPDFIVSGMIPVGMTFLSGAPKTRKSFLALQMAVAVATGSPFFGLPTAQCDVVYLDLEGSKSRIAARTKSMTTPMPQNVFVTNQVKERLADGLVERLQALHRQRPAIRLVIIDTYSRARGAPKAFGQNAYDADVQFLEPVQRMALQENIAVVFVHHDKKGAAFSSDPFERLSGTMGISGSADAVLNLITEGKRFDGRAKLEFTPRDAKGGEMDLVFEDRFCEWQTYEKPVVDIRGNPVCNWIIENAPPPKTVGEFTPYEDIGRAAYGVYLDKPGEKILEQIALFKDELYTEYNIGVQTSVKSNSKRGIRLFSVA